MKMPGYGIDIHLFHKGIEEIVKLADRLDVQTIAGPATSGAIIAMACTTYTASRKKPLRAVFLGKEGYKRNRHYNEPMCIGGYDKFGRALIVDDCVATGESLNYAINDLKQWGYVYDIVGCVSKSFKKVAMQFLLEKHSWVRLFEIRTRGAYEVSIVNDEKHSAYISKTLNSIMKPDKQRGQRYLLRGMPILMAE